MFQSIHSFANDFGLGDEFVNFCVEYINNNTDLNVTENSLLSRGFLFDVWDLFEQGSIEEDYQSSPSDF